MCVEAYLVPTTGLDVGQHNIFLLSVPARISCDQWWALAALSPQHILMGRKVFVCLFHMLLLRTVSYKVPHHDMEVLGTSAPCCGRYCLGRVCSDPANAVESPERAGGKTHGSQPTGTNAWVRFCVVVCVYECWDSKLPLWFGISSAELSLASQQSAVPPPTAAPGDGALRAACLSSEAIWWAPSCRVVVLR